MPDLLLIVLVVFGGMLLAMLAPAIVALLVYAAPIALGIVAAYYIIGALQ